MHVHFNADLMKKVGFGCGMIDLKEEQDRVLRKLHETTMSNKLRLGSNFPRAALCSRNNEVRMWMIKSKTAVVILACKLQIGNVR